MRAAALALLSLLAATPAWAWGGVPDWVRNAGRTALPAYDADTGGVVLLDETTTTVTGAGEIRTLRRLVYRILGTSGRDLAMLAVYSDNEAKLISLRAWSIAANGQEYTVKQRSAAETGMTAGTFYGDQKITVLQAAVDDPGSTIAFEVERRERPYSLQNMWEVQREVPVRVARYTLVLPDGWSHEAKWFNGAAVEPRANGSRLTWEVADVAAVKSEPRMPNVRALARRMAINFVPPGERLAGKSHRSWNDVARTTNGLVATRRTTVPALQAKVRELTANAAPLQAVAALARYAQREVRYVAIEIGIGGIQPHSAAEVLTNRYGDCKDKVTLLSTMLRELGVESYYVLANTNRGWIDRSFASLGAFNHAIIAIRLPKEVRGDGLHAMVAHPRLGKLLLFDPTDETTPFGSLPAYLQENEVLVVDDGGGELIDVPSQAPEASRLAVTAKLALDAEGTLRGEVREVRSGAIAADFRAYLAALDDERRKRYFDERAARDLPGVTLRDLVVEHADDMSRDLVIRYSVTAPRYTRTAGGLLLVRPRVLGRKAETLLDLKERQHPYETDGPSLEIDEIEIALPDGMAVDELPPPVKASSPAVRYTSEAKSDGRKLSYRREYRVERVRVPRESLAELNRTFAAIVADEKSTAVLKRE